MTPIFGSGLGAIFVWCCLASQSTPIQAVNKQMCQQYSGTVVQSQTIQCPAKLQNKLLCVIEKRNKTIGTTVSIPQQCARVGGNVATQDDFNKMRNK